MCLFESQILFYQRAGTAGVNAITPPKGVAGCHKSHFELKPKKMIFSPGVQSHTINLSSPYLNKRFGPLQPIESP